MNLLPTYSQTQAISMFTRECEYSLFAQIVLFLFSGPFDLGGFPRMPGAFSTRVSAAFSVVAHRHDI
jgi:hypothetical protein